MKLIAFDLGAHFAWAHNVHASPRRSLDWASLYFKGDRQVRLAGVLRACDHIFPSLKEAGLEAVFYERPFARGLHATRSGWGIAGVIEAVAMRYGLVALDMPPSTIKKFATGKGRASKEEMIEAARRFGYTGSDEHEADAVCALKYAEENMTKGND